MDRENAKTLEEEKKLLYIAIARKAENKDLLRSWERKSRLNKNLKKKLKKEQEESITPTPFERKD